MKLFLILCMALAMTSAENEDVQMQGVSSVNWQDIAGISNYSQQNWDGLLCALGLILTPLTGTVYGVTRCLWKTNATEVWSCIVEDIKVTATAMLAAAVGLCWIDPLFDPFWIH